ncbi:carbohydrate ABC transporter permease [Demequina sp. TTPB684]|uniref:carbohydrate ABC transporter permease n=1 Tax=unclassified Demequina TaxID=2620311 RepID=UPI001CF46B2D|nr:MULTISPECIES: carbohydrate ABC transporter permease [unclassified Demequina]MCB2411715.1 carbohydrate ABC transporter permease [Demequina sp. TTPB684]UPU88488.1 carbohydrate ABC transporter permease [Demequina sp. TMPB413]
MTRKRSPLRYLGAALAVVLALAWAFPVYWMVSSSFLSAATISRLTPTFVPFDGTLSNYRAVLTDSGFVAALQMSLVVVGIALAVCISFAFLGALAISRFRFRGRKALVLAVILVQMLPAEAMFIAQYKMISGFGLLNSIAGVSIIYIAMVVPFTMWMLRGFVAGVPADLEEAAMIDGCTRMGAFMRVTFPLLAPGLVASGVFAFLQVWNEFALASILLTSDASQTLPLWLRDFAQPSSLAMIEWGQVMAASTLVAVPVIIFFLVVQNRMTAGLVGGAVKG